MINVALSGVTVIVQNADFVCQSSENERAPLKESRVGFVCGAALNRTVLLT
jgi:hypothetical protein